MDRESSVVSNRQISTLFATLPFEDALSSDECIATVAAPTLSSRPGLADPSVQRALRDAFFSLPLEGTLSSDEVIATVAAPTLPSRPGPADSSVQRALRDAFFSLPLEGALSSDEVIATVAAPTLSSRPGPADPSVQRALRDTFFSLPLEGALSSDEVIAIIGPVHWSGSQACLTNRRAPSAAPAFTHHAAIAESDLVAASEQGLQTHFEALLFQRSADDVNLAVTRAPLIANSIHWHVQNARLQSPDTPFAMDTRLIERLLNLGARVNLVDGAEPRQSALWMALQQTNEKVVQLLLEYGCDPNASQALTEASVGGMHNHARVLLQYGANPNQLQGGKLPLNQACLKGDVEMAKLLLASGAHLDGPDQDGNTAQMLARRAGSRALIILLSDHARGLSEANRRFFEQDQITLNLPKPKIRLEKNG